MIFKHIKIKLIVYIFILLIDYISFQSEGYIKVDGDYKITMALKTTKFIVSDYWFKLKLRLMLLYFIFMFLLIVMALTYNIYM